MVISFRTLIVLLSLVFLAPLPQSQAEAVVFYDAGFPVADSSPVSLDKLKAAFASSQFAPASELPATLAKQETDLLVMPFGSAYPESAWPAILRYLDRGGNLLVLGGKPFTRAAFTTGSGWQLRAPNVAASQELFIHDYQETPGSSALTFQANSDVRPQLSRFGWKRAFSPVIRLSVVESYPSGGGTGDEDTDLTTLAWGDRDGQHLAAPVFLLDHNRERFVSGRWIFAACDPDQDFWDNATLLRTLQALALRRQDRFTFRPRVPLFLPREALEFHYETPDPLASPLPGDKLKIQVTAESGLSPVALTVPADASNPIMLPESAAGGRGLHVVTATLLRDGNPIWTYRSGFWMRDWQYLLSGPKLSVGPDYFELDGKPLPVVGTTYMAGDVSRLYLMKPNAYQWDRDMAQIHGYGLDMIRTGLWTAWDRIMAPDGEVSEDGLRAIEALLMCARHNHLPAQFNLFAFLPDTMGGENAYLDPAALRAQSLYAKSIVARFHDLPFLAWDLINEPSANKNEWKTLPDYDAFEQAAWRAWLAKRYPARAALLDAWSEPSFGRGRQMQPQMTNVPPETAADDPLALPKAGAFEFDGVRTGYNPLKVYDYFLFTQDMFVDWVKEMRALIRSTGSQQLITVGQDEGGVAGRLSPAFYSPYIDFTADHTWWDFDAILWASLAPKFPGKPLLIQESGEQQRLFQDDHLRLSPEEEGWQLERKISIAFAQGAGALEWVWNVNSYMSNDNETPIGAVRPDGTIKPEAEVLAGYAQFAAKSPQSFTRITLPDVTLVTSQVLQYSGMAALALDSQKHALRTIAYYDQTSVRMLPENRLAELGQPKLVILPAPQALTESAWQQLLQYVEQGGCLLVSGPVSRNEHWQVVDRLGALDVNAKILPLDVRQSELRLPGDPTPFQVTFPSAVQVAPIEVLRFADGQPVETISHGRGRILWAEDPLELSEGYTANAALYSYALKTAGIQPAFTALQPLSPGVLAFPTVLTDAVLYSFSSESLNAQQVDLHDNLTGAHIQFELPPQRGAALLLRKSDGAVLAAYGAAQAQAK
jgi:hypothetical protein